MKNVKLVIVDFDRFEWDRGNIEKVQKHRVRLSEVEEVFKDEIILMEDAENSVDEKRFNGIGQTLDLRSVFLVFTFRRRGPEVFVRVISARYMHKKEREFYETVKKSLY